MTSSHTGTSFFGRLSQLNCFPTMTENNRGKKNLYSRGWWGKHFPLFTSFQKRLGVPIVVSNPNQKGERTLLYYYYYTAHSMVLLGKCLLYFYYYFALFCVCVYFQGGKCESKWNKRIVSLARKERTLKVSRITRGLKKLSRAGTWKI